MTSNSSGKTWREWTTCPRCGLETAYRNGTMVTDEALTYIKYYCENCKQYVAELEFHECEECNNAT